MRMPRGFLGTRGDLLMDVVVVAIVLTPLLFLWAVSLARRGQYTRHRNIQTALLGRGRSLLPWIRYREQPA